MEYITEALGPKTGIGAFEWGSKNQHPVVISNLIQRLPGFGYTQTDRHVKNNEYKVSHDGMCLAIGVRPKASGEGFFQPTFFQAHSVGNTDRKCIHGKLSVVEKYLNIDGDGKATYKVLSVNGDKFIWTPCKAEELPTCGDLDDSIEFAELLIEKIVNRSKRYTK